MKRNRPPQLALCTQCTHSTWGTTVPLEDRDNSRPGNRREDIGGMVGTCLSDQVAIVVPPTRFDYDPIGHDRTTRLIPPAQYSWRAQAGILIFGRTRGNPTR